MRRPIVVGLVAAGCLVGAPAASAYESQYFYGSLASGARDASPYKSNFRASLATASAGYYDIDVAAHLPGSWDLYGHWVRGLGYMCHGYDGTNDLGGLVKNPTVYTQNPVNAKIRWAGSQSC